MSTFITGVPGTGKTAQVVAELVERRKQDPNVRIYQHGIRELSLDHIQVYCKSEECLACREVDKNNPDIKWAEDWHDWGKPGDLIVLDEVQRIWSPRHVSSNRPKSVSMLETHRHFGVEFWLMTQHPKLVDADVRRQMRKHVHVTAGWAGRKAYEWDTVSDDLNLTKARERAFNLPADIFALYKSADAHVEISRKKPMSLYVAIASILIAVVLGGFVAYRIKSRLQPSVTEPPAIAGETTAPAGGTPAIAPASPAAPAQPDFNPRIVGKPETAPAYDGVLKVQSVPVLAGCVSSSNSCHCYTPQATPYPMGYDQCKAYMVTRHFDPYAGSSSAVAAKSQQQPLRHVAAAGPATPQISDPDPDS
ncbi:MAG: zonular occludens toxin domain-containing protein [Methylomonas sp.]|nr:zonular occludens toxin domain-containing protein [Methylomonas sp.]